MVVLEIRAVYEEQLLSLRQYLQHYSGTATTTEIEIKSDKISSIVFKSYSTNSKLRFDQLI